MGTPWSSKPRGRSKFGNIKVTVDGIAFDSKREAAIYGQYQLLAKAGQITHLEPHPVYRCTVNGAKVCKYIPDFQFREADGRLRVFDVKSPATAATAVFRLKRKLVEALYPGVKIEIVY